MKKAPVKTLLCMIVFALFCGCYFRDMGSSAPEVKNYPPSAPANLQAVDITCNSARLMWSISVDPDGTVEGYILFTGAEPGGDYAILGNTAETEFSVNGLAPDTAYYFIVKSVDNTGGQSEANNEIQVRTKPFINENIPPEVLFYPDDSAADVSRDAVITITFDKPVRMLDNSEITDINAADIIIFKEGSGSGPDVNFTAAINAGKTVIAVTPDSLLEFGRAYYISIGASVEDSEDNVIIAAHITFTTIQEPDTYPPVATFSPADSSTGAPVSGNIILTFNEPVRLLDNGELTNDNAASLIVFKEDNDTGADINFSARVNSGKTEISVAPESALRVNHYYFISITNGFEDYHDNPGAASSSVFKTLCLVINEILYDSAGSDSSAKDNFIELYGTPGLDLTGWKIVCYNAPSGPYITIDLTGHSMPADGLFVVSESDTVQSYDMIYNGLELQNGPDSIGLTDPSGLVIDIAGYPGTGTGGPYYFFEAAPAQEAKDGSSLSRNSDHLDTDDNSADFIVLASPTPGI